MDGAHDTGIEDDEKVISKDQLLATHHAGHKTSVENDGILPSQGVIGHCDGCPLPWTR